MIKVMVPSFFTVPLWQSNATFKHISLRKCDKNAHLERGFSHIWARLESFSIRLTVLVWVKSWLNNWKKWRSSLCCRTGAPGILPSLLSPGSSHCACVPGHADRHTEQLLLAEDRAAAAGCIRAYPTHPPTCWIFTRFICKRGPSRYRRTKLKKWPAEERKSGGRNEERLLGKEEANKGEHELNRLATSML